MLFEFAVCGNAQFSVETSCKPTMSPLFNSVLVKEVCELDTILPLTSQLKVGVPIVWLLAVNIASVPEQIVVVSALIETEFSTILLIVKAVVSPLIISGSVDRIRILYPEPCSAF